MKTSDLLANTNKLFEALSVFQFRPPLRPEGDHYASHIELMDYTFNREHLVTRLVESVISWVYTKKRAREIFDQEFGADGDLSAATAKLYQSAKQTFRISSPQGQFGELLLYAFLQHLFNAVPLLRKQVVRTSDSHERFGADAIHYSNDKGEDVYLGESKCYESSYKFPVAFSASLTSMHNTLSSFGSEIRKFSAGGFIEEELRPVSEKILSNQINGLRINPVSIIIYNETHRFSASCEEDMRAEIKAAILKQCEKVLDKSYEGISSQVLQRMTYIVLPVWGLDEVLSKFVEAL